MKIAIQSNAWSDEIHANHLAQILSEISAAGYQGVETGAHRLKSYQPEVIKNLLRENGLLSAGIHTHGILYDPQAMEEAAPRDSTSH